MISSHGTLVWAAQRRTLYLQLFDYVGDRNTLLGVLNGSHFIPRSGMPLDFPSRFPLPSDDLRFSLHLPAAF